MDKKQGDAQKGALLSLPSWMTSGRSFDQWLLSYLKWFPLHGSNCSEYFIHSKLINLGQRMRMRMRFRGFLPPSGGHVRSRPQARPYAHGCFLKAGAVGQHPARHVAVSRGLRRQGPETACEVQGRPHCVPQERGSVPSGHTHAEKHEHPTGPHSFWVLSLFLQPAPPSHVRSH